MLALVRGRPLVAWAVAAAVDAGLDAVAVVQGAVDLAPALRAFDGRTALIRNPHWTRGQATSLRAGLDWCGTNGYAAAVVGLGDQPLVPASAWRAVGMAHHAPIVTATFGGRPRPPVRLDRSVWPLLAREGDEGARELMRRRPDLVGVVACEGDPFDVDTVSDIDRLEEHAGTLRGRQTRHGTEER